MASRYEDVRLPYDDNIDIVSTVSSLDDAAEDEHSSASMLFQLENAEDIIDGEAEKPEKDSKKSQSDKKKRRQKTRSDTPHPFSKTKSSQRRVKLRSPRGGSVKAKVRLGRKSRSSSSSSARPTKFKIWSAQERDDHMAAVAEGKATRPSARALRYIARSTKKGGLSETRHNINRNETSGAKSSKGKTKDSVKEENKDPYLHLSDPPALARAVPASKNQAAGVNFHELKKKIKKGVLEVVEHYGNKYNEHFDVLEDEIARLKRAESADAPESSFRTPTEMFSRVETHVSSATPVHVKVKRELPSDEKCADSTESFLVKLLERHIEKLLQLGKDVDEILALETLVDKTTANFPSKASKVAKSFFRLSAYIKERLPYDDVQEKESSRSWSAKVEPSSSVRAARGSGRKDPLAFSLSADPLPMSGMLPKSASRGMKLQACARSGQKMVKGVPESLDKSKRTAKKKKNQFTPREYLKNYLKQR